MKAFFLFLFFGIGFLCGFSQVSYSSDLFASQEPLNLRLDLSFKKLRSETNDTTYMDSMLAYETEDGQWDSLKVELRTRGNFRLKNCFFPPIKVSIKKKHAKGTLFEGNKKLKLVMPCQTSKETNSLVIKEFLCYKIYEIVTPYTFNTRLVSIDLVERSKKNERSFQIYGFLIEDDKRVAKRHGAEVKDEEVVIQPWRLHDTTVVRHDLFQYMIANVDWSNTYQHNSKIMQTREPYRNIPLAYDFDQSGFVDAAYAVVNPEFGINSPKDRVYRGFCREDNTLIYTVRDQFLQQKEQVYSIIGQYESYMFEKEFQSLMKFMEKFYVTLADDKLFQKAIIDQCRTK